MTWLNLREDIEAMFVRLVVCMPRYGWVRIDRIETRTAAASLAWRRANPERNREHQRAYRLRNRDKDLARKREARARARAC